MIRLSPTLMESFRLYLHSDWYEENELIAHICGEFRSTEPIRIGKAYDTLIEKPQLNLSGLYECDGYAFERDAIEQMRERIPPGGTFQAKASRIARVGRTDVKVNTRCDYVSGLKVNEFKTTLKSFDADKYDESYQWRYMAWVFQPASITYNVALLKEDRERENVFLLREIDDMTVYPYPALEEDCLQLIGQMLEYLKLRNLEQYLTIPESQVVASAS